MIPPHGARVCIKTIVHGDETRWAGAVGTTDGLSEVVGNAIWVKLDFPVTTPQTFGDGLEISSRPGHFLA